MLVCVLREIIERKSAGALTHSHTDEKSFIFHLFRPQWKKRNNKKPRDPETILYFSDFSARIYISHIQGYYRHTHTSNKHEHIHPHINNINMQRHSSIAIRLVNSTASKSYSQIFWRAYCVSEDTLHISLRFFLFFSSLLFLIKSFPFIARTDSFVVCNMRMNRYHITIYMTTRWIWVHAYVADFSLLHSFSSVLVVGDTATVLLRLRLLLNKYEHGRDMRTCFRANMTSFLFSHSAYLMFNFCFSAKFTY